MTNYIWGQTVSGDWADAADWSPASGPPSGSAAVSISATGAAYVVSVTSAQAAASLSLSSDATLDIETQGELGIAGALNNSGTIKVNGGGLAFGAEGDLSNQGLLVVSGGATVTIADSNFGNFFFGSVLTGGTFEIDAGSTFEIAASRPVSSEALVLAFDLILKGAGSNFERATSPSGPVLTLDSLLVWIDATGELQILGGRNWALASQGVTNNGSVVLGGGAISSATSYGLTNASGATLAGYGTVSSYFLNSGTVEAQGGTLAFTGYVGGAGTIKVDSGANLVLGAFADSHETPDFTGTASFAGENATLSIADVPAFHGSLGGFQAGDRLVFGAMFLGAAAHATSDDQFIVTCNGPRVITLKTDADYSNFAFVQDYWSEYLTFIALPMQATVAGYLANKSAYDQIAGGFAISDSANAIVAQLPALDADRNILSLAFTSGSGTIRGSVALNAPAISESGAGTALAIAETLNYAGAFTQGAGSKLVVNAGDVLTLLGTSSLSGATSGPGTLRLDGDDATFATGATLTTSAWSLAGSGTTATLDDALSYAGAFVAGAGTQLALTGGTLTLTGATTLAGVTVSSASGNKLNLYHSSAVSGLTISGDSLVVNNATATQSGGSITIGDGFSTDKAELYNATAGVWNIVDDSGVALGADPASFIANLGLLEKTGGVGTSTVAASVTDTGSVAVTSGTLAFAGLSNSFAGTIWGSGMVLFSGGATTLKAGASAAVAKLSESGVGTALAIAETLSYGGAFTQGAGSKLVVDSGDALTLSGTNSLSGATGGVGALTLDGGDTTFATGATLATSAWSLSGSGAMATIDEALSYAGAFTAGAGTQLALTGGALTMTGATTLAGVTVSSANGDKLNLYHASAVSGLTIAGDALVVNNATMTQSGGPITIGDGVSTDKAELYNAAAGVWDIADDSDVALGADPASFIANLGLFEKTGGTGTTTVAAAMANTGRILAASKVLDLQGAITGTGTDTISGPSTLQLDSSVGGGQTIDFTGSGGTLALDAPATFFATLSGFDAGGAGGSNDAIQLLGSWTETGFLENGAGTLATLTLFNGTVHDSLKLAGDYTSADFHVSQLGVATVIN